MSIVRFLVVLFYLTPLTKDAQLISSEYNTTERRKATSHMYAVRHDITREDQGFVVNEYNKKDR